MNVIFRQTNVALLFPYSKKCIQLWLAVVYTKIDLVPFIALILNDKVKKTTI